MSFNSATPVEFFAETDSGVTLNIRQRFCSAVGNRMAGGGQRSSDANIDVFEARAATVLSEVLIGPVKSLNR